MEMGRVGETTPSIFYELCLIQHSFAVMVRCLTRYKPFLPQGLLHQHSSGFHPLPPSTSPRESIYGSGELPLSEGSDKGGSTTRLPSGTMRESHSGPSSASPREEFSCVFFQFGTVLYINYWGTHERQRARTPVAFANEMEEVLTASRLCLGTGLLVCLFGDRLAVLYQRSTHVTAAVAAARRLLICEEAPRIPFSAGIATGRLLTGSMGCWRLRTANALGPAMHLAWELMQLATRTKVDVLVDEEVMEKARFNFVLTPVAMTVGPLGSRPRPCYRVLREAAVHLPQEEWMYSLAASDRSNAFVEGTREHVINSVFQEWRRTASTSASQLAQLQAEVSTSSASEVRDGGGFLLQCIQQGSRHQRLGWFALPDNGF
eukprot:RCo011005